tara:strand:+ start:321 stop:659 length:339 start_codon:yes stop_codon:yes gene_type:complete
MAIKNSVFEVTEDFLAATESDQDKAVRAFSAANPKARVEPKEVGQSAPFLRKQSGKRFEISECINQGGSLKEILNFAKAQSGGERDVAAHLAGGFSRTSKFYGQSFVTLYAA